jgi:hypothetical protein
MMLVSSRSLVSLSHMPVTCPLTHIRGMQVEHVRMQVAHDQRAARHKRLTFVSWSLMRSNLTTFKAAIKTSMRCIRPALLGLPICSQRGAVPISREV